MIKKKDIHLNCTKGATFFWGGGRGSGGGTNLSNHLEERITTVSSN